MPFLAELWKTEAFLIYTPLLKRLRSGEQKGWTQNIVRLLFQLAVEQFNRPLDSNDENGESRLKKFNNVKLMAAIFKREMPGLPDGWITDCADTLIYRLDTRATEQSVEQLCLFLRTLLIAEPGENCDSIIPTRQRQLLTCFDALERAATPSPKVSQQPAVISDARTWQRWERLGHSYRVGHGRIWVGPGFRV